MEKEHIAFKCTYNNGGEGVFVGFNGTCSEDIIRWNIRRGRVWCGQENCKCRKYYVELNRPLGSRKDKDRKAKPISNNQSL